MSGIWVGAGAVVGGLASAYGAKQANKPKTGHTDQTTEQTPYLNEWIEPDINAVLQYQRGLLAKGAPQLGPNGQITYEGLPWGAEGAAQQQGGPVGSAAQVPRTPKQQKQYDAEMARQAASKARKKGGAAPPVTGTQAPPAKPAGPNLSTPQGIFSEVARRGLDAGNTETQQQARTATGNILGAAGGGGPEHTGFEGYNPVLDRLTGRLESNADRANARDLLMGFLDENDRAGGYNPSNGGDTGGRPGLRPGDPGIPNIPTYIATGGSGGLNSMPGLAPGTGGGSSPSPAGGSGVPDTMAVQSYFGDETRKIMDEQANEAELEQLIRAMNEDVEKGMFRDLAALDASEARAGRFGGSTWSALNRDAREEAAQEMLKTSSQVRVGDREARRQARLAALSGVNTRDLGLLGANVQREGIAAGERSANASIGAGSAAAAEQIALAKRGQDLSAIGQLMGNEEFNLGQLGSIGGQLSSDRLATLGMVPGLEGIGLQGLQMALGAGGGLTDLRGQDTQRAIANQQAGIARSGLNQQMGMFNASQQQQMVNDYLRTLMGIGGMGGSSRTTGTNVVPGAGISPVAAGLTGALGGAATGAGIRNMGYGY